MDEYVTRHRETMLSTVHAGSTTFSNLILSISKFFYVGCEQARFTSYVSGQKQRGKEGYEQYKLRWPQKGRGSFQNGWQVGARASLRPWRIIKEV